MRAILLLAVLSAFAGCATDTTDEDEVIDLSPSSDPKADGSTSTSLILGPGRRTYVSWTCNEFVFELNGCTMELKVNVGAMPGTTNIATGSLVHTDLTTKEETQLVLNMGDNILIVNGSAISAHSVELKNTSNLSEVFTLAAHWW